MIDDLQGELKRARALDINPTNPNYQDRFGSLSALEDIILPVWGDVNNLDIEKIGGEVDIRWIKDIDELRNQLACALRIPLQLLGGYQNEIPSSLGASSLERVDIRFARQARRLQRSLINGITRLVQIHLAYQGIDPDLNLFKIQMAETSSAEEEELKNALGTGIDVVDKLSDLAEKLLGVDLDKKELFDYMNKKFLKLNDLDVESLIKKGNAEAFDRSQPVPGIETPAEGGGAMPTPEEGAEEEEVAGAEGGMGNTFREDRSISDFKSAIPLKESSRMSDWQTQWGAIKVKIEPVKENKHG
jgi:hypothetical protein